MAFTRVSKQRLLPVIVIQDEAESKMSKWREISRSHLLFLCFASEAVQVTLRRLIRAWRCQEKKELLRLLTLEKPPTVSPDKSCQNETRLLQEEVSEATANSK